MRTVTFILLLALTGSSPTRADEVPAPRTISVTGRGEVSSAPDQARVSFAVETAARTAAEAATANATTSAAVAKALRAQLGEGDEVETSRYSLDPSYEPRDRATAGPPRISGYVARNEVRVQTAGLDRVGALIDAAIAAGANRVSGLEFTLRDPSPAQREAVKRAGEQAGAEARAIAEALGLRVKRVLSATTAAGPIVLPRRYEGIAMAAEARTQTPIEPGDLTVTATLQVTYEVE